MVRQCTDKLEPAVVSLPAGGVAHGPVTDPLVLDSLMLVTSAGHLLAVAVPTALVESNERLEIDTTAGRAARLIVAAAGLIPPIPGRASRQPCSPPR